MLSTTAKARERARKKEAEKGSGAPAGGKKGEALHTTPQNATTLHALIALTVLSGSYGGRGACKLEGYTHVGQEHGLRKKGFCKDQLGMGTASTGHGLRQWRQRTDSMCACTADAMETDEAKPSTSGADAKDGGKDKDTDKDGGDKDKDKDGKAAEPEASSYTLSNPARVVPAQLKFVSLGGAGSRCACFCFCVCVCGGGMK